jgi:hypothetical protein
MSIQKVSFDAIQKVRKYIKTILALPDSENHPKVWISFDETDEPPEPESLADLGGLFNIGSLPEETTHAPNAQGQWFISASNPGAAITKLPGVQLKPNLRLASYLHRFGEDGIGAIWALPEALSTTANLEKALADSGDYDYPPHPEGALENFMEAIEGDRSAPSFVIASILLRELREFGALGKHCDWSHHRIIQDIPTQVEWNWRGEVPSDLSPKVRIFSDGKAAVEFFTCRVTPPVAIFQHIDQYPAGLYRPNCLDRIVATVQRT